MPDPSDYKSALDELERAMKMSQGQQPEPLPPMGKAPAPAPVDPPPTENSLAKTLDYKSRAEEDIPRINALRSKMEIAARKHLVPVEYLEGIASRESRGGKALNEFGYDDAKQAYGVMQIDERFHPMHGEQEAPDSQEHIDKAAGILQANKRILDKKFPQWSNTERWQGAIAAYNMGAGNVRSREHLDEGTTGGDYSQDVLIRSQIYKQRLHSPLRRKR